VAGDTILSDGFAKISPVSLSVAKIVLAKIVLAY
jgi:hypothetical protein